MALIASYSGRPAFAAKAALNDKYCSGTTGESVIMSLVELSLRIKLQVTALMK